MLTDIVTNGTVTYDVIEGLTTNVFGSPGLALAAIFILVYAFCLAFKIPLEIASILMFPFAIVLAFGDAMFIVVVLLLAVHIAFSMAKNFFLSD